MNEEILLLLPLQTCRVELNFIRNAVVAFFLENRKVSQLSW
jgi:hypothetical protein